MLRILLLQALLLGGLSVVFLLPQRPEIKPASIAMELPDFVGEWYGEKQPISEKELQVLPVDTQFARRTYINGTGDQIFVSIVFSGEDMNNSIHRPERCLPAQGWGLTKSDAVTLKLPEGNASRLPATLLHGVRTVEARDGTDVPLQHLNYYWFVGHQHITNTHLKRTFIDMQDRVLHGFNQQWAYVTVAATVTDNVQSFGKNEAKTDEMLRDFIIELFPKIEGDKPATIDL